MRRLLIMIALVSMGASAAAQAASPEEARLGRGSPFSGNLVVGPLPLVQGFGNALVGFDINRKAHTPSERFDLPRPDLSARPVALGPDPIPYPDPKAPSLFSKDFPSLHFYGE